MLRRTVERGKVTAVIGFLEETEGEGEEDPTQNGDSDGEDSAEESKVWQIIY